MSGRRSPAVEDAVAQMLAPHLVNPAAAQMLAVTLSAAGLLREGPLTQEGATDLICTWCDEPIEAGESMEMPTGEHVHMGCWTEVAKGMRR